MIQKEEIWRSIKNFPDYEVSNLGRVRSCKPHWRKPHIIVGSITNNGYHRITLYRHRKREYCSICHLVLEAFIGPRPKGYEANHKNGVKVNDELENLEWITSSENTKHAYRLGLMVPPNAKLKKEDVLEIRRLAKQGIKQNVIAKRYKMSEGNISAIIHYKLWASLAVLT